MGVKRLALLSWRQLRSCSRTRCRLAPTRSPASSGSADDEHRSCDIGADTDVLRARQARPPRRHAVRRHGEDRHLLGREHSDTGREERRSWRTELDLQPRRPGRRSRRPHRRKPSSSSRRSYSAAPALPAAAPAPQAAQAQAPSAASISLQRRSHADRGDPRRRRSRNVRHGHRRRDGGCDDRQFPTALGLRRRSRCCRRSSGPRPRAPPPVRRSPRRSGRHASTTLVVRARPASPSRSPCPAHVLAAVGGAEAIVRGHRGSAFAASSRPAATGIEGGQEAPGCRGIIMSVRQLGQERDDSFNRSTGDLSAHPGARRTVHARGVCFVRLRLPSTIPTGVIAVRPHRRPTRLPIPPAQ